MNLSDEQKQKLTGWIGEGMKLSDIQKKLESDFGLRLTYLDVRFLVDDLKLTLKDPEPPKAPVLPTPPAGAPAAATEPAVPILGGKVSVTVDQVTRPGSLVSGRVTFSDGETAAWYLDEAGRLGLVAAKQGYKPKPEDVQEFQRALQTEMQKLGY